MTLRAAMLASIVATAVFAAGAAPNVLSLKIMDEVVPPGGIVQIKLMVTEPKPIVRPGFDFAFNEAMIDDVLGIALHGTAFSAVRYDKGRLTVVAPSMLGAITVVPDYPVLTLVVRVAANLAPGTRIPIDLNLQGSRVLNAQGQPYVLESKTGWITVGGTLSVSNVLPGAGVIAAGQTFRLIGTGFVPGTRIQMEDGGKISIVRMTPTELVLKGTAPFQLEGEQIRVQTPDKQQVEYFSYLRATRTDVSAVAALNSITPVFPFGAVQEAVLPCAGPVAAVALENPTRNPIVIRLVARDFVRPIQTIEISLGARQTTLFALSDRFTTAVSSITLIRATSPQPFRIGGISFTPRTGALTAINALVVNAATF